jgi:hypothetical protein
MVLTSDKLTDGGMATAQGGTVTIGIFGRYAGGEMVLALLPKPVSLRQWCVTHGIVDTVLIPCSWYQCAYHGTNWCRGC